MKRTSRNGTVPSDPEKEKIAGEIRSRQPRVMIAAAGSGQGKTMLTCALLKVLLSRGEDARAFKCGPDYIDPMFHRRVLSVPSYNLDSFFADRNTLRFLLSAHAGGGFAVIEGVMGYYDGLGGVSERASSFEIAKFTDTPVILLIDAPGSALSALAVLKGFLTFHGDSQIRGVIFNRLSPSVYPALKERAERELSVRVAGYIPKLSGVSWDSRHLGLIRPEEIPAFHGQILALAGQMEKTVDFELIRRIGEEAKVLTCTPPAHFPEAQAARGPSIAVARDEAFCFYYPDNLELLERMGARLLYFSPIRDRALPEGAKGLYLGGGYPELCARQLCENAAMRGSVREALRRGMPCIAECGGYLYLKGTLTDAEQVARPMAGFLSGNAYPTGKLARFGYATLKTKRDMLIGSRGAVIPVHEFHHWDCEENGTSCVAVKPATGREWECVYGTEDLYAGFPHLYFYSDLNIPRRFLQRAKAWNGGGGKKERERSDGDGK